MTASFPSSRKECTEDHNIIIGERRKRSKPGLQQILNNLADVESNLRSILQKHRHGKFGFVTREWGFTAPGGLGKPLGGKFYAWENKLKHCKTFFWPIECYEAMEIGPDFGKPDHELIKNLPPEGEQLYGNTPLHRYLREGPFPSVNMVKEDYYEYRDAARIFLLLGTLSHMYGNSAPGGPKTAELPIWIEDPLIRVAERLQIEPSLSGHFLVQENWIWKNETNDNNQTVVPNRDMNKVKSTALSKRRLSKIASKKMEKVIVSTLLKECVCEDRLHLIKVYPDCFIGSQCVDVVVDNHFTDTREEAVRLLRKINQVYSLFTHASDDHYLLMDKRFNYQFQEEWKTRRYMAINGELEGSTTTNNEDNHDDDETKRSASIVWPSQRSCKNTVSSQSNSNSTSINVKAVARLSASYTSSCIVAHRHTSLQEKMSIISAMASVKVKDRRYGCRIYKKCFVGKQLIDVLTKYQCAPSRKDCLGLALAINQELHLFEHVKKHHLLKDKNLFYRFTEVFRTMVDEQKYASSLANVGGNMSMRRVSFQSLKSSRNSTFHDSAEKILDKNLQYSDYGESCDAVLGVEEDKEFRLDNITMLYPAFGNNHERINQLVPACMGFALSSLPFDVLDMISAMRDIVEVKLNMLSDDDDDDDDDADSTDNYEIQRLYDLIYKVAFCLSKCKEEFQQMSTDPSKRTFNSKYVSIKQTQPLSNGVLVRRINDGESKAMKGTTGTQFPYFHLLDWLLGRYQFKRENQDMDQGIVEAVGAVDETFPMPQREYILCLSKLTKSASLRGIIDIIGRPKELITAYNHLIECYAGEGGMLQAHCRKLYSYIHNNVQSSTSGTNHLAEARKSVEKKVQATSGCPMSQSSNQPLNDIDNHKFAVTMFKHMRKASEERWKLRLPPLMSEVGKIIYSTSESGGFTTVALDLSGSGLLYEYGDVVKVLLENNDNHTSSWLHSLACTDHEFFTLGDMQKLHKHNINGWGWDQLWEALGWCKYEKDGGKGVPLELIARYIEKGQIRDETSNKPRWVHSPLDLSSRKTGQIFAVPPLIPKKKICSLEPVSPRVYSVSGVELDRVFLLVSKPDDDARHHGYIAMSDPKIMKVHCSFSPATFFLVPPKGVNLVCIASGTGISPFVGLVDSIGSRSGSYTIIHQCRSSDMFMCNSQTWLDFTAMNPGSIIVGYISGDRSRRNCPIRYIIRNGAFEETTVLRRKRISAYYFECKSFQSRIFETYLSDGLNLAYCCGGVKSAIMPLQNFVESNRMNFEFTCESYGVPPTLTKDSNLLNQIGGAVIDLNHVSPIHPGGDQIMRQLNKIMTKTEQKNDKKNLNIPDQTMAFYELHPHAYNLLRCLRTPLDSDSNAFTEFLERQAMTNSVLGNMATKYAQAVLSSPETSKIVKIATELQSSAISVQLKSGDIEGAKKSAFYLRKLLHHVPADNDDVKRWQRSLSLMPQRKSSMGNRNIYD